MNSVLQEYMRFAGEFGGPSFGRSWVESSKSACLRASNATPTPYWEKEKEKKRNGPLTTQK